MEILEERAPLGKFEWAVIAVALAVVVAFLFSLPYINELHHSMAVSKCAKVWGPTHYKWKVENHICYIQQPDGKFLPDWKFK